MNYYKIQVCARNIISKLRIVDLAEKIVICIPKVLKEKVQDKIVYLSKHEKCVKIVTILILCEDCIDVERKEIECG